LFELDDASAAAEVGIAGDLSGGTAGTPRERVRDMLASY
jgi:hypothetical protein